MNLKAEEGRSKNELMHLIVLDYYNFFFVRIFFTLLSFPYVSVPLRGFRHERFLYAGLLGTFAFLSVSVPLRGFRHES